MPFAPTYTPDPRFPSLGDTFFDPVRPARFPRHVLRHRDDRWAARVGLSTLTAEEWEACFARFEPLPSNIDPPIALRYHGHQFGVYNPQLGDGRGFLHAQLRDDAGRLLDLGTKGSGRTPWSRGGDGKLTLKGGVREVLATSMLEALGVDTSKSLSLFETGESLHRGDEPSPTRSSVLVRLSHSHIRFGTFQRLAYVNDTDGMRALVEYAIAQYFLAIKDEPDRVSAFFREVVKRSATLAASWMAAGFVHGVLNTDNMNITGESFDYGPYRFLPTYDVDFVAAYFDESGLYAFGRQPSVILWNLSRLADALRRIEPTAPFGQVQGELEPLFVAEVRARITQRLGLTPAGADQDGLLVDHVFTFLEASQIGFERFFYDWYGGSPRAARALTGAAASHYTGEPFAALRRILELYTPSDPSAIEHAYFARGEPCTLLIDEIEAIWNPIAAHDDWRAFEQKIARIAELREAIRSISVT
jgi:uncharacterized protein YdiU (UPF0061 family)